MRNSFPQRQAAEINSSPVLRFFGLFLALVHTTTYFFWFPSGSLPSLLSRQNLQSPALCWPFWTSCSEISFSPAFTQTAGALYLLASLAVAAFFFISRSPRQTLWAWWGLLVLNVWKYAWLVMDYRTMGNYHYMPFILSFCYLFLPGKQTICAWMIVLFYVAAGSLKLNLEWLSGSALFREAGAWGILLEWMCAYVVILELVLVWGLLTTRPWIRWLTLAQLAVFHLYSFRIVGFFYPVIMTCLLSLFPLMWWREKRERTPAPIEPQRLQPIHLFVLGVFVLAQIAPRLQSGDPALRSEGRLFSLNMFDARSECTAQIFIRYEGSTVELQPRLPLGTRIACDPLVYWNVLRDHCSQHQGRPGFQDIDILLSSKRTTDTSFTRQMAMNDFCRKNPPYRIFSLNAWGVDE